VTGTIRTLDSTARLGRSSGDVACMRPHEEEPMSMTVADAQADMRTAYHGGAPGILASALAWSAATVAAAAWSPERAIWVLLVGGMLIHPVAVLLCRLFGASGSHAKGNPFASLAAASTFWLIFSLPLAYGLGLREPAWFFAAMLLVIGGRYLVFATLFGLRSFWALGLALAAAGAGLAWRDAGPLPIVAAGAGIELAFAIAGLVRHRRARRLDTAEAAARPAG
jgi:hypothetical protein